MPESPGHTLLRPAVDADIPAIIALEEASFAHPAERFAPERVRHLACDRRFLITVAQQHDKVIGWIAGFVWPRAKIPWGRIYAIAVDTHARGQNLGRGLMQHMIDMLEKRGARRIFLEVRTDNHAALRLYEKLGFVKSRTLADYYAPGLSAVRLVRAAVSPTPSSPVASP